VLAAAVSMMLFAAIGSAALLGWLPVSRSAPGIATTPAAPVATAPAAAVQAPVVEPATAQVQTPTPARPRPVLRKATPRPAPVEVVRTVYESAPPAPVQKAALCHDCGTVESVREVSEAGAGSGLGAVIGGVTGGIVGRQFGGGRGKDLMTVVGAVGGGVAGHQIEKRVRATKHYEIAVRFDDGSSRVYTEEQSAWRAGDRVRLIDGRLNREL
jgi:outer membrane lipoprotein SlyB